MFGWLFRCLNEDSERGLRAHTRGAGSSDARALLIGEATERRGRALAQAGRRSAGRGTTTATIIGSAASQGRGTIGNGDDGVSDLKC